MAQSENTILHSTYSCTVERCQGNIVRKSGTRVSSDECEGLLHAWKLKLPVPRVHKSAQHLIEMDFVEGETLDKLWPTMTDKMKIEICGQLRAILTIMRSSEPDERFIGSCGGGAVRDGRRYCEYTGGPFSSEAEFNEFICDFVHLIPIPLRRALKASLRTDHRIVFTHGDLTQHNIIVRDGKIVAIIDWEYAGWFPEYWEYIKFFERPSDARDWKNYADLIFPHPFESELVIYQSMIRWQRP